MSKKKTTEDKNLDIEIDFAIDENARTMRVREGSRAYLRGCSVHSARRRTLRAYYVNLLLMNWYVS